MKTRVWTVATILVLAGTANPILGSQPHDDPHAKPAAKTPAKTPPSPAKTPKAAPAEKPAKAAVETDAVIAPDDALRLLSEGNERWVKGAPSDPAIEPSRRAELAANGQKPFVTILTCADSRVPVERVFDRGVGELFVIRVAGNIAGDSETGTIEYGIGHLKTPLLVVMGHTKCGAVAAAASGAELHGKVAGIVANIVPAVDRAKRNNPGVEEGDLLAAAVKENVWQTVFDLLKYSTDVREAVSDGRLRVVGAVCDVSTGKVSFLGEHPWQTELLAALTPGGSAAAASADEHDEPGH